jgi:hypothetical protein
MASADAIWSSRKIARLAHENEVIGGSFYRDSKNICLVILESDVDP